MFNHIASSVTTHMRLPGGMVQPLQLSAYATIGNALVDNPFGALAHISRFAMR
jgi:hypothetical protein